MFKFSRTGRPSLIKQKGLSLFLVIIILAIILAIVFGLSTISVSQIKITRWIGDSVVAFYAADTGIEKVLGPALKYVVEGSSSLQPEYPFSSLENNASYEVKTVCCFYNADGPPHDQCYFDNSVPEKECPAGFAVDSTCEATHFCVRSVGEYKGIKRAIEVKIKPISP